MSHVRDVDAQSQMGILNRNSPYQMDGRGGLYHTTGFLLKVGNPKNKEGNKMS